MNAVDLGILVILILSTLLGALRGLVKESLSLVIWVLAFWLAIHYSASTAHYFAHYISTPSLQIIAAFITLLVLTLLLGGGLNYLVVSVIRKTGLGLSDRVLGIIFGICRGILIVSILLLLVSYTFLIADPWWKESKLIPYFESPVHWLHSFWANVK